MLTPVLICELNLLGFEIKALARSATGEQPSIIGDVATDMYFTVQKLLWRDDGVSRWCGDFGERSRGNQDQPHAETCQMEIIFCNCRKGAHGQ